MMSDTPEAPMLASGSKRGRGRGGDSGRRARGAHMSARVSARTDAATSQQKSGKSNSNTGDKVQTASRDFSQKPSPTHFISLPIGHHEALRASISNFTSALLQSTPPITGFDQSIVVSPRRLHLTLGVMSLTEDLGLSSQQENGGRRTLEEACSVLESLRKNVMELLGGERLRVGLERMDIMRPDRGDASRAHVMYVGPISDSEDAKRLKAVGTLIQKTFKQAGLMIDERRPLKLHCTVVNTRYRRPRPNGPRKPFSYTELLQTEAFRTLQSPRPAPSLSTISAEAGKGKIEVDEDEINREEGFILQGKHPKNKQRPMNVDFGTWDVDEIQICEMGSYGPEGEYVRVGGISLV